jgi:hypothetical protein
MIGLGADGLKSHPVRSGDNREYRADYATFEEYCKARWNRSRALVNRLITAAEAVNNLVTNCHQIETLPSNEGQAGALAKNTDTRSGELCRTIQPMTVNDCHPVWEPLDTKCLADLVTVQAATRRSLSAGAGAVD